MALPQPKNYRERFEFTQRIRKHIDPLQMFKWFVALAFPATLLNSLIIGVLNDWFGEPSPWQMAGRMILGLLVYTPVMVVVYWKVFLPARQRAEAELEQEQEAEDSRLS